MATIGEKNPNSGTKAVFKCRRCGRCCSSAFLALSNVPADDDREEIAQWLKYHGCEPMRYPSENGDVLAVKIPIACEHLVIDEETKIAECSIYEKRPMVCRKYFCKKTKQTTIAELVKEHGICI